MKNTVISPKAPLRVGLVGSGYVSTYHARALKSLGFVEIVGVADPNQERAQQLAAQFGIPGVYRTLKEMAAARPQVVHILTPPALHCALTLEALEMGCHVFVEKPMAETPEECDQMMAKAAEVGRILSVNHSARMDPIVLKALELVKQGVCGDVLAVDFFRSSDYAPHGGGPLPPQYRNGAYPFQDLGVHGLYLLEAFLGEVKKLDVRFSSTGHVPNLLFNEWRALAECEKGSGQMYLSWSSRPMQNELVIHGTRGSIQVDCFLQTIAVRGKLPAPRFVQLIAHAMGNAFSTLYKVPLNVFRFATGKLLPSPGIHVCVRAFYEALVEGTPPPVPAEEGRRMVRWMDEVSREANAAKDRRLQVTVPVSPARILVTGAAGMLGGALLRRLCQEGETVRVLVRRPSESLERNPLIQVVYGDLGDPEAVDQAVDGVDTVYHVGAAMGGGPLEFQSGTIWGTKNVIDSCLRHNIKKLVYVSSMTVLDHAGHSAGNPVTESSPLEPHADWRGLYTQTKLQAEKLVLQAVQHRQLPAVILRPGQIFGPGAEKFAPSGAIGLAGRWVILGSGNLPLPLVYVEDVVDALVQAGSTDGVNGRIFQLVDPEAVTQNEYVGQCQKANPELRAYRVPRWVLACAGLAAEILGRLLRRSAPLSRYRVKSARPIGPCDCSAAREGLGWIPRVGTRQGLEKTFHPKQLQPRTDATPELAGITKN
jgi:predicted dehydrogenase/nucleoside-diphosphate-sugar epimerase